MKSVIVSALTFVRVCRFFGVRNKLHFKLYSTVSRLSAALHPRRFIRFGQADGMLERAAYIQSARGIENGYIRARNAPAQASGRLRESGQRE